MTSNFSSRSSSWASASMKRIGMLLTCAIEHCAGEVHPYANPRLKGGQQVALGAANFQNPLALRYKMSLEPRQPTLICAAQSFVPVHPTCHVIPMRDALLVVASGCIHCLTLGRRVFEGRNFCPTCLF